MPRRSRVNPFYALLVVLGTAFTVTACAYGVMSFLATRPPLDPAAAPHPLLTTLDRHGGTLMAVELVLLSLATWGAIGTDHWWNAPRDRPSPRSARAEPTPPAPTAGSTAAGQGAIAPRESNHESLP